MTAGKKKAQQDEVANRKITRLPASPIANLKQRLNITSEKKKAQQDKNLLSKKTMHQPKA